MNAVDVKSALYGRHHASGEQMPGAWTCVEEWRGIDLLAWSAWSSTSGGRYARIGYEVKVSRSDLRAELLRPGKRAENVRWCNEFYLAVPKGLLTPPELAFVEPAWPAGAFERERCPYGRPSYARRRRSGCFERVPVPTTAYTASHGRRWAGLGWVEIPCRVCGGRGYLTSSLVEREAPTCWVPADVGLVVVDGRGCQTVKKAPRRQNVPALTPGELGQLVRFVSMRPDPRHLARNRDRILAA